MMHLNPSSGENRQLHARLLGPKSEQPTSRDRSNHPPSGTDANTFPPQPRGHRIGRPGPQRRTYRHLRVVDESTTRTEVPS
jgi:hypothetical protein